MSAPESTAPKRRLAAELCSSLTTLVRECEQAATIVMGDLNVAASAADRLSGKLERYDEGTNSLVLALRRLGLTDCHEAAGPSAMGFTFCPKGKGVSRVDYVWANGPAIRWSSADRPARAAVATRAGPLSADHVPVVARITGCFQWGAGPGAMSGPQRAVGVGPAERPRRRRCGAVGTCVCVRSARCVSVAQPSGPHGGGAARPLPRPADG